MSADRSIDQDLVTKADLMEFQERLLLSIQEQFAVAEQRTQERFAAAEQRTQERFAVAEQRIQERFAAAEQRTQEQFTISELHMREHVESIETRLLTAFQQWAVPVNSRMRRIELGEGGMNERLITIEERLMSLEKRLAPPHQGN